MAVRGSFEGLEPYRLTGVRLTERELGHGSYAAVLEVEYRGLKCAGKKLYRVLYEQGVGDAVRRFEEECRLLSQVRHPNIVQLLGVYFEEGAAEEEEEAARNLPRVPILVMEYLPKTLAECIDRYGVLRKEINYSVLRDVALGLYYLHSNLPPIIHRDLSANNVLLTPNMTAKISDLGVAKILHLTPLQVSRMTRAPGTLAYMPPEAIVENPQYTTRIDEFSYGILMIHVFSGRWPIPQCAATRTDPQSNRLLPVSEADRRDEYLQQIGLNHPLMGLIRRCINNNPDERASASDIAQQMSHIVQQFPTIYANIVEMYRRMSLDENVKQALRTDKMRLEQRIEDQDSLRGEIERLTTQVQQVREDNLRLEVANQDMERCELARSIELVQVQQQLAEKTTQNEVLGAQLQVHHEAAEREQAELTSQIERWGREMTEVRHDNETLQAAVVSKSEKVMSLTSELLQNEQQTTEMKASLSRVSSELASKGATVETLTSAVHDLNEQLSKARDHLFSKVEPTPFLPRATIKSKRLADIPMKLNRSTDSVVIGSKVYIGGGFVSKKNFWIVPVFQYREKNNEGIRNAPDPEYHIFVYDFSTNEWNPLPRCPVRCFGLSQWNGRLVTVGGLKHPEEKVTNEVYEYDEENETWTLSSIPPMPPKPQSNALYVVSHNSSLIVARVSTKTVLVFRGTQWFTINVQKSINLAPIQLQNIWHFGSVNDLLVEGLPVDQLLQGLSPTATNTHNDYVWKTLCSGTIPAGITIEALLSLADSCILIGHITSIRCVFVYNPHIKHWQHIVNMPFSGPGRIIVISATDFLLIGSDSTVIRGTVEFL